MKLTFHLFLLELKRTLKFLPRIAAVVFVLAAVLAVMLFAGEKTSQTPAGKVAIGYYSPDNDAYVSMIINMVKEMDSVKSICTLEPAASEQAVYDGIKSKKYYGGIVFPKEYVQGIMYGDNTPARIIVPRGNNNFVFRHLVSIGSDMLITVQAGIYATADGKKLSRTELMGINLEYVNFVLGRSSLFKKESWSPYGSLSFTQYYCVMALAMLTVLLGSALSFIFYDYGKGFESYCRLWRYNGIFMLILKQILVFLIILAVTTPALIAINNKVPFLDTNYFMIAAAIFISSQIITCFYTVFGGTSVLPFTALAVVMGFLSGCFIPLVYLGGTGLDKLCDIIPLYTVVKCFSSLYTYNSNTAAVLYTITAIYAVTIPLYLIKRRAAV